MLLLFLLPLLCPAGKQLPPLTVGLATRPSLLRIYFTFLSTIPLYFYLHLVPHLERKQTTLQEMWLRKFFGLSVADEDDDGSC